MIKVETKSLPLPAGRRNNSLSYYEHFQPTYAGRQAKSPAYRRQVDYFYQNICVILNFKWYKS